MYLALVFETMQLNTTNMSKNEFATQIAFDDISVPLKYY